MTPKLASALMPLARLLDPERAHDLALWALGRGLVGHDAAPDDPVLATRFLGLSLANPLGLAAGFDKNAVAIRGSLALGFGCVEIGTVTPRAQDGNPRPRLFRLAEDGAAINRNGFANDGWLAVAERLRTYREEQARNRAGRGVVGVNLGINKDCTAPEADYAMLLRAAAPLADYLVLNVSSPNTPGLRDLQAGDRLARLLDNAQSALAATERRPPLLVKIAPDLDEAALAALVDVALLKKVDGLIVSNTTITRPDSLRGPARAEAGGLSGAPLFALSTETLRRVHRLSGGRLPLIGVGGVASGADAYAKILAGASVVQLYTALAFHGPALVGRIKRDLAACLRADGFASVAEAVGAEARLRRAA